MLPLDDPTSLSLLFHLNSEPWLNDEAYRGGSGRRAPSAVGDGSTEVALPPPTPSALGDLLRRRRSCRAYDAHHVLPLEDLSELLHAAYGPVVEHDDAGPTSSQRSVPSAGGLYPFDVLVFLRRVEGIEDGLYHYDPPSGVIRLQRSGDLFADVLGASVYAYPFIVDANALVVLVASFLRTQAKYGPRGYRYILLEAGHVGQNLTLRAAELGLGSLCIGGFVDSMLNEAIGIDPRSGGVMYGIGIGRPAS